ncbi:hypothetical protein JOB18_012540 [Solea senegalensis]|uniref:Uncharacterized protein n=1 Tax=Solea senegalensis TaxID=28829 RepID=A0AAV6QNN1_SOLSE|nr:hypothetical protein JOB18_012540 [Solea senegalensis]
MAARTDGILTSVSSVVELFLPYGGLQCAWTASTLRDAVTAASLQNTTRCDLFMGPGRCAAPEGGQESGVEEQPQWTCSH